MQYCLLDGFLYQIFFSLYQILMSLMFVFSKARVVVAMHIFRCSLKIKDLSFFAYKVIYM